MTDELLPCPFCGGQAETLTANSMHGGYLFGIMCNDCRSRGDVYDNEAEAIAAWNSRADYHGYEQAAIEAWQNVKAYKERTCRITEYDEAPFPVCSECGAVQPDDFTVYYCWNCGAKVVDE